ncbi:hypothetical protein [Pelagibius sp.]|uniref:hypothetical protein n=1 Tax=Pelagibius sp. TaxID=1931238 RepID=UPI003B503BB0
MQRGVDLAAPGARCQRNALDDIPDGLRRLSALLRTLEGLCKAFHLGPVEAGNGGQRIGQVLRRALQPHLEVHLFGLELLQARHQGAGVAALLDDGDDLRDALFHLGQRPAVGRGRGAAFAP